MTSYTSKQHYWGRWHGPVPGRWGQQDQVQGQSWLYRVPGQPGPHETHLKKPKKPFLQDRKSVQPTVSSDFILLPHGRKTHQRKHTYPHLRMAGIKCQAWTHQNQKAFAQAAATPTGPVREHCPLIHSLPHCLSLGHNRAKPQNQREVAT